MSVPVEERRTRPRRSTIGFEGGTPVSRERQRYRSAGHELIAELNEIGGKHGVGQTVLVENRLVGMKSPRRVRNARRHDPLRSAQGTGADSASSATCSTKSSRLALRYAELVYYGQWFHPLREALQAFMDQANACGHRHG